MTNWQWYDRTTTTATRYKEKSRKTYSEGKDHWWGTGQIAPAAINGRMVTSRSAMLKGGGVGRSPRRRRAVRPVAQPVAETDRSAPSAQPAQVLGSLLSLLTRDRDGPPGGGVGRSAKLLSL